VANPGVTPRGRGRGVPRIEKVEPDERILAARNQTLSFWENHGSIPCKGGSMSARQGEMEKKPASNKTTHLHRMPSCCLNDEAQDTTILKTRQASPSGKSEKSSQPFADVLSISLGTSSVVLMWAH
jgi:hypothetical protein